MSERAESSAGDRHDLEDRTEAAVAETPTQDSYTPGPPRWKIATSIVLSLFGLGVSIYLTIDHFKKIAPVCPGHGSTITCAKVTTSPQSYFLHIPVALLGLVFYVVMTLINLPPLWRAADRRIHLARLVLIGGGMLFALYLVSAELLIIDHICLWCTSVHVITFFLFVLIVTATAPMLGWGDRSTTGLEVDDESPEG